MPTTDDDFAIVHHTARGAVFRCASRDLSTVIEVSVPTSGEPLGDSLTEQILNLAQRLAAEAAEFGAWHALEIYPTLPSFTGYGTLRFQLIEHK